MFNGRDVYSLPIPCSSIEEESDNCGRRYLWHLPPGDRWYSTARFILLRERAGNEDLTATILGFMYLVMISAVDVSPLGTPALAHIRQAQLAYTTQAVEANPQQYMYIICSTMVLFSQLILLFREHLR